MGYRSAGTAQKKIDRLAQYGYIVKHHGPDHPEITITLSGYSLLEALKQNGNGTEKPLTGSFKVEAPAEKRKKFFRLHALQIKYWLREQIPEENIHLIQFRDHPTRLRNLRNHCDLIVEFKDFNVTVTTRALKITGIEVRLPYEEVNDPDVLLEKAGDIIAPEIENIEGMLSKHIPGLKLRRLAGGVLDANVVKGEIAIENDGAAINIGKIQKQTGEKFKVYDRKDGKLAAIVDYSKGPPEFETIHPQNFVEHIRTWKAFADDLLSGEFYEKQRKFQESLQSIVDLQKKQEELQANSFKQFDERINQHLDLINGLAAQFFHALDELKNYMAQNTG